jgi:plastocyanin
METRHIFIIGVIAIFGVSYFAISWYATIGEEFDCNDTSSGCITSSVDLKPNVTIIAGSAIMKHNLSPSKITIRIGEQVTWYNDDDTSHWIDADDGSWSSGLISPQSYFTMKFEKAGTFTYHGQPWIRGTVIVTEKHDELEDVWIAAKECIRGNAPADNYTWNSQNCSWEHSPLRNENSTGPPPSIPADPCGSDAMLIDGICQRKSTAPLNCVGYVFGFALDECLLSWYIVLAVVVAIIVGAIVVIRRKNEN